MDTKFDRHEIIVRAGLDRSPHEIVEIRRAQLKKEIRRLAYPMWFLDWLDAGPKYKTRRSVLSSLFMQSSWSFCFIVWSASIMMVGEYYLPCTLSLYSMYAILHFLWNPNGWRCFVSALLWVLLPFGRLVQFLSWNYVQTKMEQSQTLHAARTYELACLSTVDAISYAYIIGLRRVSEEFIGERSPLQKVKVELAARSYRVLTDVHRLDARIFQASSDPDRLKELREARRVIKKRDLDIAETQNRVDACIKKIETFLAECEGHIMGLAGPLGDAQLLREVAEGEARDAALIAKADELILETVEALRERLVQVHNAVHRIPQVSEGDSDKELETYFKHIEAVAARVDAR
jgi:hypothetical protein